MAAATMTCSLWALLRFAGVVAAVDKQSRRKEVPSLSGTEASCALEVCVKLGAMPQISSVLHYTVSMII